MTSHAIQKPFLSLKAAVCLLAGFVVCVFASGSARAAEAGGQTLKELRNIPYKTGRALTDYALRSPQIPTA